MRRNTEAKIEQIIAACDGNVYGALKALILVNEQLEAELQAWRAAGQCESARQQPNLKPLH